MPRTRSTAGPDRKVDRETLQYDGNCKASPSCLDCPLPRCKHDDPSHFKKFIQERKDLSILKRNADGEPDAE